MLGAGSVEKASAQAIDVPHELPDASDPDVATKFTANQKVAVEGFLRDIGRGEPPIGESLISKQEAEELTRHFRAIPPSAPGAEAAQSELSAALQRTKMWPPISEAVGGAARTISTTVATRAVASATGGFVLWEIGCAAGVSLPLCHHEHVRLTTQQVDNIRYRFTGSGAGNDALCVSADGLTAAPSTGTCPIQQMSQAPKSGPYLTLQQPKLPAKTMALEWTLDGGAHWKTVSRCWAGPEDYTYGYFSFGNLSDAPVSACNPVVLPPPTSFSGYAEGLDWIGQAWSDDTDCGVLAPMAPIPCHTVRYHSRVRSWYLDAGTTRTLEAPLQGTDPLWPATGSGTLTRLESDMPPSPAPGGATTTFVAEALAENPNLRREIVDVFNQQYPEDAPGWEVTQVNGGPATGQSTVPRCVGTTADTCIDRLRTAGFTGGITATHLDQDDAIMELPADRVTGTMPPARSHANLGTALTAYVNPPTMPELTEGDFALAAMLEASNPDTINEKNKFTVAQRCRLFASAEDSGRTTADCHVLPMFITGGGDAQGPAQNDFDALAIRNPKWFLLNHRVQPFKYGWYDGRAEPAPGCVDGLNEPTILPEDELNCHEFPFWSTMQAYRGSLTTAVPSIRWTSGDENQLQGRKLSKFFSSRGAGRWPAGCRVVAAVDDGAPALESAFINIPIPMADDLKTTWACNKPTSP